MGGSQSRPIVDLNYPPPPATKPNGKVINGYTIEAALGKGAFGKVFRVKRNSDGHLFAMKVQTVRSSKQLEMIRKELIDVFEWNWTKKSNQYSQTVLCIIIELVEGPDLEKIFKDVQEQGAALPQEIKARWLIQLCRGVAYLHKANKIHRDIKPANILVQAATCTLKIADFGLAKELGVDQLTQTKGVGTPMYMAPEMTLSPSYDYKVDVWAVGLILLEMFGDVALDPHEIYYKRLDLNWDGILGDKLHALGVPPTQQLFLRACLMRQPAQRFKMTDLIETPLFRGYALCFGLVPADQVQMETEFLLKEPALLYPLVAAVESKTPAAIRWALDLLCELLVRSDNAQVKQHLSQPDFAALIDTLATQYEEARRLQEAMKGRPPQPRTAAQLTSTYRAASGTIINDPDQFSHDYDWSFAESDGRKWTAVPERAQTLLEQFRKARDPIFKEVWAVIVQLQDRSTVAYNLREGKAVVLGSCQELLLKRRPHSGRPLETKPIPAARERTWRAAATGGSTELSDLPPTACTLLSRVTEVPHLAGLLMGGGSAPEYCFRFHSGNITMLDLSNGKSTSLRAVS